MRGQWPKLRARTTAALLAGQQKDYHSLFDRVVTEPRRTAAAKYSSPTSASVHIPSGQADNALEEFLYFQYGRYLMISSTRPAPCL